MKKCLFVAVLTGFVAGPAVFAQDDSRVEALERKVAMLEEAAERRQFGDVIPALGAPVHGMAAAASKVYGVKQGVSIGGYGEALYQRFDGDKSDEFDFLRAVLYFGYKYTDQWVFNSEIEFEHASTGKEGEASVEFAYLDYLASSALNFRAGLLLMPVGIANELHEPTAFLSARRPLIENSIIPTTWRENGIGLFGELAGGFSYKAYVVNGLRADGFSSGGLRGGRQKGSKAKAEDFAGVIRLDYQPMTALTTGASFYQGDSGQDLEVSANTSIVEAHMDYRSKGLEVQALYTQAEVDDAAALSRIAGGKNDDGSAKADAEINAVGETLSGWYVQLGYDLMTMRSGEAEMALTPFVRYSAYNTQDSIPDGFKRSGRSDVEVTTIGVNFKPIDEVVFKVDYQMIDNAAGTGEDQLNVALGYVF
jgi:hypothetical protein